MIYLFRRVSRFSQQELLNKVILEFIAEFKTDPIGVLLGITGILLKFEEAFFIF